MILVLLVRVITVKKRGAKEFKKKRSYDTEKYLNNANIFLIFKQYKTKGELAFVDFENNSFIISLN